MPEEEREQRGERNSLRGVSVSGAGGHRRQKLLTPTAASQRDGSEPLRNYNLLQMMAKHKAPKTVMRYDHGRENLEQNAVNFLGYDEE